MQSDYKFLMIVIEYGSIEEYASISSIASFAKAHL